MTDNLFVFLFSVDGNLSLASQTKIDVTAYQKKGGWIEIKWYSPVLRASGGGVVGVSEKKNDSINWDGL